MKSKCCQLCFFLFLLPLAYNCFGQKDFSIKIEQKSYISSTYEVQLTSKKLIIFQKDWDDRAKKIYSRKIWNKKKLSPILHLIASDEFQNLEEEYLSYAIDGYRTRYEIVLEENVKVITNENGSEKLLCALNEEINELIRKKNAKILLLN